MKTFVQWTALAAIVALPWAQLDAAERSVPGHLVITIIGCNDAQSSTVRVRDLATGKATVTAPMPRSTKGIGTIRLDLPEGYYSLASSGGCATVASVKPFGILAGEERSITLRSGKGIGLLFTGYIAVAGELPRGDLSAIAIARNGVADNARIDGMTFYFDELTRDTYIFRFKDWNDANVAECKIDLTAQPTFSLKVMRVSIGGCKIE